MDLMLHLGVTYLRLGHRTQRGLCGKLTTVTTDVMQVMQLTLTRHARVRRAQRLITYSFICVFFFFLYFSYNFSLLSADSYGVPGGYLS